MRLKLLLLILAAWLALPALLQGAHIQLDPLIDEPALLDPLLDPAKSIPIFHPRLKEVWIECLKRPDADTRRRACDSIGLAFEQGAKDMTEMAPLLLKQLVQAEQHHLVRMSAAQALIRLEAKSAAQSLLDRDRSDGTEMALLVDPALARWDFAPARELWLARLKDPQTLRALRVSAMESLAAVKEPAAAALIQAIMVNDEEDIALRLVAAQCLGRFVTAGMEGPAGQLAKGDLPRRMLAGACLQSSSGAAAQALLHQLAADQDPAVAALGAARLLAIDPALLKDISRKLLAVDDVNVRRIAAEALFHEATPQAIATLAGALNDSDPGLRQHVRNRLLELGARSELNPAVCAAAGKVLMGDDWRGLEQAALIAGQKHCERSADRLLELLHFPRTEVNVAAAAALRWLALPDYLPRVLKEAQSLGMMENDQTVAQLFQLFGTVNYRESEPYLRNFIPKGSGGDNSRCAAIWAIGKFHEGVPDNVLGGLFASRLSDLNPMMPESSGVRRQSAVAIGRMKAAKFMGPLREFYEKENTAVECGGACRWSIMNITGTTLPPLGPVEEHMTGWFIEPEPLKALKRGPVEEAPESPQMTPEPPPQ